MRKKPRKTVSQTAMRKYVLSMRLTPIKHGESLLEAVSCILSDHGFQRGGRSARRFIEDHSDLIQSGQPQHLKPNQTVCAPKAPRHTQALLPSTPPVSSDAFLKSYEWRRLRMSALKLHGARCQCCGITPAHGAVMNVDHIKPRKLFPELALSLENLQVLCGECNHGKGNWDMTDWRTEKVST